MLFSSIKPMLLHMGKEIEDNEDWLYEIKWDGWRILIHKQGDEVKAYTRHGNNVTNRFPELQEVGRLILSHTAILDTELKQLSFEMEYPLLTILLIVAD